MANFCEKELEFFRHHLFLLPGLPQKDDQSIHLDDALLQLVAGSLNEFGGFVSEGERPIVHYVGAAVNQLIESRNPEGAVHEEKLMKALKGMYEAGSPHTIPLHISAQNACVIFRKQPDGIHFEAFEVSPHNDAAMSTRGRLIRCFPGPVLCTDKENFKNPEFLSPLVKSLSKLSFQKGIGMTPTVRKGGKEVEEPRDTTNPGLVTELIVAYLQQFSSVPTVEKIHKHTREEVLWKNDLMPWRRSPLWLLIRIVMQLLFTRSQKATSDQPATTTSHCLYKLFMIYLFGSVLEKSMAAGNATKPDILFCMSAKIHRRLLKLNPAVHEPGIAHVQETLERTRICLEQRWLEVQKLHDKRLDLGRLQSLKFDNDISFSLPGLDEFLSRIPGRSPASHSNEFYPAQELLKLSPGSLPANPFYGCTDYLVYNLNAFEHWVASALSDWVAANLEESGTCAALQNLMSDYYSSAKAIYAGNPETSSIMILTLLELWIACDKSALALYPLLHQYDPGVQLAPMQTLLVPSKDHMIRLLNIEKYLQKRKTQSRLGAEGSIFRDYGTLNCFSVKYYDASPKHKNLLKQIETAAEEERRQKCIELHEKKNEYRDLIRQSEQLLCEYFEVRERWCTYSRHKDGCRKCALKAEAERINIEVHEWPLPSDNLKAKSVVFELDAPQAFCAWRDATIFLLLDVFGARYHSGHQPRANFSLFGYDALRQYFRGTGSRRLSFLSEDKPHVATHRGVKFTIQTTTESDVCLKNGLDFHYYDSAQGCFVAELSPSDAVPKMCTYQLPEEASTLQPFIFRRFQGQDSTPNEVISSQSECPEHLSLEEYRCLAGIPVMYKLQWINILSEVQCPILDFKKPETSLVMFQAMHQAGPRVQEGFVRDAHFQLAEETFTERLLPAVEKVTASIAKNWEFYHALSLFSCIVARQLSLSPSTELTARALTVLGKVRDVGFSWLDLLRRKRDDTEDENSRDMFAKKIVIIAMICSGTFDVDGQNLEHILLEDRNASILIQCGVLIHELYLTEVDSQSTLPSILHRRWQRLSYRAYPLLVRKIVCIDAENCLDLAVKNCWPVYRRLGCWETATSQIDHWVVSKTRPDTHSGQSLWVHYNLLTGDLLVNGLPLSRLPSLYEEHKSYSELFGRTVLQIMPSSKAGMQFSCKQLYAEHSLDFGLEGSDILIRATKDSHSFDLIPKRVFDGKVPSNLISDFVQWYNTTAGTVEFRSKRNPWAPADDTWTLAKGHMGWIFSKRELTLINPFSPTGETLAGILSALQERLETNIILSGNKQRIDIELPNLKLGFSLDKGGSSVRSRQFRGLEVDSKQSIGTLVGLKNKLVLKATSTAADDRRIIVPAGEVSFARNGDHVSVRIAPRSTSTHVYRLDRILGPLKDNESLKSKLFLCYLHAITSFCLPDPLTYSTGTEQALSILKSAAVESTSLLTKEDMELLRKIELLTPRRAYYPDHLQVMQTVIWNEELPVLGQHSQYHQRVRDLWQHIELMKLYYPNDYPKVDPPVFSEVNPNLLRRDNFRSSTFSISGFGAEDFLGAPGDDVTYKSRDLGQSSERSERACLAAAMLFHRQPRLRDEKSRHPNFRIRLLELLKTVDIVRGPDHPEASQATLDYDGDWLEGHASHWASLWCWLHRQSQDALSTGLEIPQLMLWLATMSFSSEADMGIIQVAASMFSLPRMRDVRPPQIWSFRLQEGDSINDSALRTVLHPCCLTFLQSPECDFPWSPSDSSDVWQERKALYEEHKNRAINNLLHHLTCQWPSPSPAPPLGDTSRFISNYIELDQAMSAVRPLFKTWYENRDFSQYLQRIESVDIRSVQPLNVECLHPESPQYIPVRHNTFISSEGLFASSPSGIPDACLPKITIRSLQMKLSRLGSLIHALESKASSRYEHEYAMGLRDSLETCVSRSDGQTSVRELDPKRLAPLLDRHLSDAEKHADNLFNTMRTTMHNGLRSNFPTSSLTHGPHISPVFLLRQLSHGGWDSRDGWRSLPVGWKPWIVAYGIALTEVQRAKRLINSLHNSSDLKRELKNEGHTNWDPIDYPDSLLLEVESNIMIREVQELIAKQMREPEDNQNTTMQLNMGEGKSSVIAPAVTVALADGSRLVRVVVAKPQSRQMFHMLVSKLGGLLNRKIFHLPFSRDLKLDISHAKIINDECKRCIDMSGVMLVQPEHILSFKLMCLESLIPNNKGRDEKRAEVGQSLLQTQHLFDTKSRDIVDESDENFSVKFELIYTMGEQEPIDFAPERWTVIQRVLDVIGKHVKGVKDALPSSIDVHERHSGSFPRVRLFKKDATKMLLGKVAKEICEKGLPGFPISRLTPSSRESVLKYITQPDLDLPAEIEEVERGRFWTDTTQPYILLLRGLFAGGILEFSFGHKRWRVNYGLDNTRRPPTKLAIPYRAKDNPTPRSEFSHPDVVIILTCACYYYGGLSDDDLFLTFDHFMKSNQANGEYVEWVRKSDKLPDAFRSLTGVNMEDTVQCKSEVFPSFRFAKPTIDYYLQFIVFPKQMKQFPQKLSTSGWDIGAVKSHPTTGFSGTVDSRKVLPLDVAYLPLPEQKSTNAQVLQNLLLPENGVILLEAASITDANDDDDPIHTPQSLRSEAETLLRVVVDQRELPIRVILDVGAQILEMSNAQVATKWLEMAHAQDSAIQGAIFFDDNEELIVVDVNGFAEPLRTSPFAEQLDVCLVFLDEAHTRGIDLKLPQDYRAAVTLGMSLTKDRLAQACMRMRKLGEGQTVVFCVPQEIQTKINDRMSPRDEPIGILHILEWAISETHNDARKSMPLWAAQGQRFERQCPLWSEVRTDAGINMTAAQAERFCEDESQSLEQRYRPKIAVGQRRANGEVTSERLTQIQARCEDVGSTNLDDATLQEEQERELSPEAEQERQIQRPPPAEAAKHSLHADLVRFVLSGILPSDSDGFMPAFQSLRATGAAQHLDVSMFPQDILVTADFARTIKAPTSPCVSDEYQRPVQWILTSQPHNWKHVIIISPYEAQQLLPDIKCSGKTTLHVYAPQPNLQIRPLDGLDLYTVPFSSMQAMTPIPLHLKIQLNIFAGQLYFNEFSEYTAFCDMYGLSWQKASEGTEIAADGFILSRPLNTSESQTSKFTSSPVKFLKDFLMKTRKDCQSIDKTHLGKLLDGALLQEGEDFQF